MEEVGGGDDVSQAGAARVGSGRSQEKAGWSVWRVSLCACEKQPLIVILCRVWVNHLPTEGLFSASSPYTHIFMHTHIHAHTFNVKLYVCLKRKMTHFPFLIHSTRFGKLLCTVKK